MNNRTKTGTHSLPLTSMDQDMGPCKAAGMVTDSFSYGTKIDTEMGSSHAQEEVRAMVTLTIAKMCFDSTAIDCSDIPSVRWDHNQYHQSIRASQ